MDKSCCRFFFLKNVEWTRNVVESTTFLVDSTFFTQKTKKTKIDKKCCRIDNISLVDSTFLPKKRKKKKKKKKKKKTENRQEMLSNRQHLLSILDLTNRQHSTLLKMQNRHENTYFRHVFGISTLPKDKFRHATTKSWEMLSFFFFQLRICVCVFFAVIVGFLKKQCLIFSAINRSTGNLVEAIRFLVASTFLTETHFFRIMCLVFLAR